MKDSFVFIGSTDCAGKVKYDLGALEPLDQGGNIFTGSSGENAAQLYRDGQLLCIFSGYIYSYSDPSLPCGSEAEYIIAAYRSHGEQVFNCFEGNFTLTIIDLEKNTAYFARDHFGGRPLYYSFGENFVMVADKPSPLANCGLIKKEISLAGLCDYFSLRFIPAPNTIFENVHALEAGRYIKAELQGNRVTFSERCYWDAGCASEDMIDDYDKCRELLREALISSVEYCCADRPTGVFLSGGIDSTVVTGTASTLLGHKIDTFTIGFNEEAFDESPRARIAAEAHKTDHHLYILDYNETLEELDKIISGFDQPFADASAIPTWVINRYAAELGVNNVLTGDGSDQIFAGSNKYLIRHYVDRLMKLPAPARSLAKALVFALPDNSSTMRKLRKVFACVDMSDYEMRRRMLQLCLDDGSLSRLLKGRVVDKNSDIIAEFYARNRELTDELTNTLYVDLKVVADGGMMTKMGSMSRLAGVNTHMPMMSKQMLELAFRIPPQFKQKGSTGKIILKDAFSDVIPDELKTASKKGFEPPVSTWFRGQLQGDLRAALAPEKMEATGVLDPAYVSQLIDEHCSMSYDRSIALWALYVFGKWYEREFC